MKINQLKWIHFSIFLQVWKNPFLLEYAETHYKFKLPWSPLFRKWPEIFIDGPRFFVPDQTAVFYLLIKDAAFFPITIKEVAFSCQGKQGVKIFRFEPEHFCNIWLDWLKFELKVLPDDGDVLINAKIVVENKNGKMHWFLNSNYPGIANPPLKTRVLESPLPYPDGWKSLEPHCHSEFSSDPVEFGAPLELLQECASSLGLDYVFVSDHSYDFCYRRSDYMQQTDPHDQWKERSENIDKINKKAHFKETNQAELIPAEEVSCGNHLGENVHFLIAGHSQYIPGIGDGGRRWFNNRPDLSIEQVLAQVQNSERVFTSAAHPGSRIGWLEKKVFRRGDWSVSDIISQKGLHGLQFWNGPKDRNFLRGRGLWVSALLKGERILPLAGNDAHGDFNRSTSVKIPLLKIQTNQNHVFGQARTLFQEPLKNGDANNEAWKLQGLKTGPVTCTDGPFLNCDVHNGKISIFATSLSFWGKIDRIHLFAGIKNELKEKHLHSWTALNVLDLELHWDMDFGYNYVRAECWTDQKRFALTSALFLAS